METRQMKWIHSSISGVRLEQGRLFWVSTEVFVHFGLFSIGNFRRIAISKFFWFALVFCRAILLVPNKYDRFIKPCPWPPERHFLQWLATAAGQPWEPEVSRTPWATPRCTASFGLSAPRVLTTLGRPSAWRTRKHFSDSSAPSVLLK